MARWTLIIISFKPATPKQQISQKICISTTLIVTSVLHATFTGLFFFAELIRDSAICLIAYEVGKVEYTFIISVIIIVSYLIIFLKFKIHCDKQIYA